MSGAAHTRRTRDAANTEAVEDYAKAIYALARRGRRPGRDHALAERLGVSPASVSAMLKRLAELGLVEHEPYHGVELTQAGRAGGARGDPPPPAARAYLAEALGMPWDRVHDEAEVLEHDISEELEERIAAKLGDPSHDPHGDPIPDRELDRSSEDGGRRSPSSSRARAAIFARVSDSDPEMLRYLAERGIRPGRELRVIAARAVRAGRCSSRSTAASTCSGTELAAAMRVPSGATVNRVARRGAGHLAARRPERAPAAASRRRRTSPSRRGRRRARRAPLARRAARGASRASGPSSARRSSPRSPTSTRATSPPTSPAAPSSATCCSGWSSRRT